MKLINFREALKMTKAAIDEAMIPIRVSQAKKQGEMEQLKLDEKMLQKEIELQQLTVAHPINYDAILDLIDDIEMLERRRDQFGIIIEQLFSEPKKGK